MAETTASNGALPVKSADEIVALSRGAALEERWVDVPEWGSRLRLRELSRAEILWATDQATTKKGRVDEGALNMHLFIMAVQEPKFTQGQYRALSHGSSKPVAKVMKAVRELIGLTDDEEEERTAIAEAEATFPANA